MKRIVVLGEGRGEAKSASRAVSKLLSPEDFSSVYIDENVIRTGEVGRLLKNDCEDWRRLLRVAQGRGDVGGVVLLLDADVCSTCPIEVAKVLAEAAQPIAAAGAMSVCPVFAFQEFESWLLAGLNKGVVLADGRAVAPSEAGVDFGSIRDAKGRLKKLMEGNSYRPTRDQLLLTDAVDWDTVKSNMRSYRRLDSAVRQIIQAVNDDTFVVSPVEK